MRSIGATAVTALLLLLAGPLACGLDTQGLLATDSGMNVSTESGDDASGAASDDEAAMTAALPAPDAGRSDATAIPAPDASSKKSSDSGPPAKDAALDAPSTCKACVDQICSTQVAACGTGSDCLAYRDCSETCSAKGGQGGGNCSSMCQSMYPAGQTAFAALTLCAVRCGAGCVAVLTVGTP
jgi:hypothetical protein